MTLDGNFVFRSFAEGVGLEQTALLVRVMKGP